MTSQSSSMIIVIALSLLDEIDHKSSVVIQPYVAKSFFSQVKTLYFFFLPAKMILSAKEVVSVSETNYANEMVQRTDSSGDLIYVKESFTATRRKESVVH